MSRDHRSWALDLAQCMLVDRGATPVGGPDGPHIILFIRPKISECRFFIYRGMNIVVFLRVDSYPPGMITGAETRDYLGGWCSGTIIMAFTEEWDPLMITTFMNHELEPQRVGAVLDVLDLDPGDFDQHEAEQTLEELEAGLPEYLFPESGIFGINSASAFGAQWGAPSEGKFLMTQAKLGVGMFFRAHEKQRLGHRFFDGFASVFDQLAVSIFRGFTPEGYQRLVPVLSQVVRAQRT